MIFEGEYPSVYNHLKNYKERLVARKDKGVYWWELRSCGYYDEFEKSKIVVQCIAYYSRFALDEQSHYVNNEVIIVPTDDHYILAILNSRIVWWIVNRTFQHMKDEGLSVDVQFLKALPIPDIGNEMRASIGALARQLVAAKNAQGEEREIALTEIQLNALVEEAFALTDEERQVLVASLPPRDPLANLEAHGARLPSETSGCSRKGSRGDVPNIAPSASCSPPSTA